LRTYFRPVFQTIRKIPGHGKTASVSPDPEILEGYDGGGRQSQPEDSLLKRGTIIESIDGWTAARLRDTLFNYFVTDGYNLTGKYQYLSSGFNFSFWYQYVIGFKNSFTIDYLDTAKVLKNPDRAL